MRDRYHQRSFILEITNEKTLKVVRIMHPHQTLYEDLADQNPLLDEEMLSNATKFSKIKLKINRLGLSVVNSQAREILYTSIFNLRFS